MPETQYRNFNIKEINEIEYLQPEGWEDIKNYFKFYHESPFCYPIVAVKNNHIIGLANGIKNKTSGWLSHIIVAEDFRGQGIGFRLTELVMQNLSKLGCNSQLLIATKMGEGLYAKLGFKTTSIYKFFIGDQLNVKINDNNIHVYEKKDFAELMKLDLEISGEYREQMISKYLQIGWIYRESGQGELTGYYLSKLGDGVILAKNKVAGIELLKLKHSLKECKTVLPDENKDGQNFLIGNGFQLHNQANRMVLGEEVNWKPQGVFCRIGGFYG